MKGAVAVVVQILISLIIVALTMPVLIALVPAAQGTRVGPAMAVGLGAAVFVILRLGWPRPTR